MGPACPLQHQRVAELMPLCIHFIKVLGGLRMQCPAPAVAGHVLALWEGMAWKGGCLAALPEPEAELDGSARVFEWSPPGALGSSGLVKQEPMLG